MLSLARCAGVTDKWAKKVVDELSYRSGHKTKKKVSHGVGLDFTLEEEVLLLAL
jgi:hypothetical protein